MTASGQYIAQIPQRLHASRLTTGRNVLQEPVKPIASSFGVLIVIFGIMR